TGDGNGGCGGGSGGGSGDGGRSGGKGKGRAAAAAGAKKYTPMEQQVVDLKRKHPDVLLLVECGYRFRFFGKDAEIAAQVLRVYAHMDHNFMVASIPTHRLIVGVVRQMETAAVKAAGLSSGPKSGTFKRELVGMFTPATFIEGTVEALIPSAAPGATSGGGEGGGGRGGG
ncbi:unnamed protein product, partial [Phaeothamnion confervicola]